MYSVNFILHSTLSKRDLNWKLQAKSCSKKRCELYENHLIEKDVISAKTLCSVGSVTLSLYDIATGPTHFDFDIKSGRSSIGRLIFDCEMSQKISLKITSKSLVCKMNKTLNDRYYYYVLTLIDPKRERIQSERSGVFENIFLNQVGLEADNNLYLKKATLRKESDGEFKVESKVSEEGPIRALPNSPACFGLNKTPPEQDYIETSLHQSSGVLFLGRKDSKRESNGVKFWKIGRHG